LTASTDDLLLRVADVVKSFSEAGTTTRVLRGASLELPRGETASLTGPSGSGKSTLIGLVAGLMRPDTGRVVYDGTDITLLDDAARCRLRRHRIGIVLQHGNSLPFLTARENVELVMELAGLRRPRRAASSLLTRLGLLDRLDHLPARLSGGEVQRVALAMALARAPDLLIADEVTGELDSSTAAQVMDAIFEASRERGLTVLYVTHQPDLAALATHRWRLTGGLLRAA